MLQVQTIDQLTVGDEFEVSTAESIQPVEVLYSAPAHPSRSFDHEVVGRLPCGTFVEILGTGDEIFITMMRVH